MANRIAIIRDELVAGHPVTGAYDADDALAAAEMNALNIDAEGGVAGMVQYLTKNRSRTNIGDDTVATSIMGRLESVGQGQIGDDPFGTGITSAFLEREHIHSALGFLFLLSTPQVDTFDFINAEVTAMLESLGPGVGMARVWKDPDIDALKALSQDQQSQGTAIGVGFVTTADITAARET